MKYIIYARFLGVTSILLNLSIKYNLWSAVNFLINFRKKHIVKTLRKQLLFSR